MSMSEKKINIPHKQLSRAAQNYFSLTTLIIETIIIIALSINGQNLQPKGNECL